MQQSDTYWVFGYGSLMWNPGFAYIGQVRAVMRGAHRRLCVLSMRHRGTPDVPGLVFGLLPGGACPGLGFEVERSAWPEVSTYLRERERDNGVYLETRRPLRLEDGRLVTATTFVVDRTHVQFAGRLSIDDQLERVCVAEGESGANIAYVRETLSQLRKLGILDRNLDALVAAMDARAGRVL